MFLESIIPDEKWLDFKSSKAIVEARKIFEEGVKREFTGDENKEFHIRLRGAGLDDDPENNLLDDEWTMEA